MNFSARIAELDSKLKVDRIVQRPKEERMKIQLN